MGVLYLLFETASGFGLFERTKSEEIGIKLDEVQRSVLDLQSFSKIIKLKAFLPFVSAESALESINAISEGEVTPELGAWLEQNLPKSKGGEKAKFTLGVIDPKIGNVLTETLQIKCESNELVAELLRGIRLHFERFLKVLKPGDLQQAQLGLGHSYSRTKVKFNVHRVDNMIIQSIALLDQLDKDLNTYSMRVREWYGWHFPELVRVIPDNALYCKLAHNIQDKSKLSEESLSMLEEITGSAEKAKEILEAARMSMGTDIAAVDMANIAQFSARVMSLAAYREKLANYLGEKMEHCAPNLRALIGDLVGARLIAHAGSLTNLAKYPASTVQILGAEKALFRALKTKGNTPKYGLIFHSTFIGRAGTKNKGRISRYLANKASLASRIDSFSEVPTSAFGHKLRQQVEDRLEFYKTGAAPKKNIDVMQEAIRAHQAELKEMGIEGDGEAPAAGKKTKRKAEDEPEQPQKKQKKKKHKPEEAEAAPAAVEATPAKKKKKEKKAEPEAAPAVPATAEKKKKKKKEA